MNYLELLNQEESEFLDFKKEWHDNNADLVLDILALANSETQSNKYLVIGIEDKTKCVCSVDADKNRKTTENLNTLIRASKFNIKPLVKVHTIKHIEDNAYIDIIEIRKTNNRPYFLLEDKREGKTLIRAGVVYTRDGDSNTPRNSTASEYQIAKMWEERFGINLSPEDRLEMYIKDYPNWKSTEEKGIIYMYYSKYPEFTIGYIDTEEANSNVQCIKSIGETYSYTILCKYHSTVIKRSSFISVDNHRYKIAYPDWVDIYYTEDFSEIIPVRRHGSAPEGYDVCDLCNNNKYKRYIIYYRIVGDFDYHLEQLYNDEKSLDYFYNYFSKNSANNIYLLAENVDVIQACKDIFIKNKCLLES